MGSHLPGQSSSHSSSLSSESESSEDGSASAEDLRRPKAILGLVKALQSDHDLCDVIFQVGSGSDRAQLRANSTLLSLSSPYFRAMLHGPWTHTHVPSDPHILPDVAPAAFRKVLDFLHGQPDCQRLASLEEAWKVRYAAVQFLLPDLTAVCDEYLDERMSLGTALRMFKHASDYCANDYRKKIWRCISNRGRTVLASADLRLLGLPEMVELVKLYRDDVGTDLVLDAFDLWSDGQSGVDKKLLFRQHFFKAMHWDSLSKPRMLQLHRDGWLTTEDENKIMLKLLARKDSEPSSNDAGGPARCMAELEVKGVEDSVPAPNPPIRRLVLRTVWALKPGMSLMMSKSHRSPSRAMSPRYVVDREGLRMLREVGRKKSLRPLQLPSQDDVLVEFDLPDGHSLAAENLHAAVYCVRCDNRDVFFFDLTFDPVRTVQNKIKVSVTLDPALMLDLREGGLTRSVRNAQGLDTSKLVMHEESSLALDGSTQFYLNMLRYESSVGGKVMLDAGGVTPKYMFQEVGVPIFCFID